MKNACNYLEVVIYLIHGKMLILIKAERRIKMDCKDFIDYANGEIINTAFEIEGEKYGSLPFDPMSLLCISSFNESGITLYKTGVLFKERGEILYEISFGEIDKVEIMVTRWLAGVGLPRNYYIFNLVMRLKDGRQLYFDCGDLSVITKLVQIFKEQNIHVDDVYNMESLSQKQQLYDYLEKNFDDMAEKRGLNPYRRIK